MQCRYRLYCHTQVNCGLQTWGVTLCESLTLPQLLCTHQFSFMFCLCCLIRASSVLYIFVFCLRCLVCTSLVLYFASVAWSVPVQCYILSVLPGMHQFSVIFCLCCLVCTSSVLCFVCAAWSASVLCYIVPLLPGLHQFSVIFVFS